MTDRPADGGFTRAMIIGLGFSLVYLLFEAIKTSESPTPERIGKILATFIIPAVVAGFIVNGRRWSWRRILLVYLPFGIASLIFMLSRDQKINP